eukprot:7149773-Pyramimonas_sp.AAC.2
MCRNVSERVGGERQRHGLHKGLVGHVTCHPCAERLGSVGSALCSKRHVHDDMYTCYIGACLPGPPRRAMASGVRGASVAEVWRPAVIVRGGRLGGVRGELGHRRGMLGQGGKGFRLKRTSDTDLTWFSGTE